MATFGDLYQNALDVELGSNDSAVLFTTARRQHAINEGLRQFADLTECLVRQSSISVSSSAREFDLNSTSILPGGDFLRVAAEGPVYRLTDSAATVQTLAGDEDFPQRTVEWLDAAQNGWRSTQTGWPSGWYLRPDGGSLYFGLDRPATVGSSETAEILLPYLPQPSSMTASTDVPFAVNSTSRKDLRPYHQALVHYAAHDLEKLRKDTDASDKQLQKFLGYVQRYLQATRKRAPQGVRSSQRYFAAARKNRQERGYPRAPWWYR